MFDTLGVEGDQAVGMRVFWTFDGCRERESRDDGEEDDAGCDDDPRSPIVQISEIKHGGFIFVMGGDRGQRYWPLSSVSFDSPSRYLRAALPSRS